MSKHQQQEDPLRVPRDESLEWFLCHSEGELGMASSFASLVDAARGGWGGGSSDRERRVTERRFGRGGTVKRSRDLRTRFLALPLVHREVLWLAYGPHAWPRETMRALGQLAGVALITKAAHGGYQKAAGRADAKQDRGLGAWLVSACLRPSSAELEPVVTEAGRLLQTALAAWWGPSAASAKRRPAVYIWKAPAPILPARVFA